MFWVANKTKTKLLDNNFKPLPTTNVANVDAIQVIHSYKKSYLFSLIPMTWKISEQYLLVKGDKKVTVDKDTFEILKDKTPTAEAMFNEVEKTIASHNNEAPKNGLLTAPRFLVSIFIVFAIIGLLVTALLTLTDKVFDQPTKDLTKISELKTGDYVNLKEISFVDATGTSLVKVSKSGSTTTTSSDKYGLAINPNNNESDSVIVRFDSDKNMNNLLQDTEEDSFIITNVKGQVKNISEIEKLKGDEQIVDAFKSTEEYLELKKPELLIDTKVENVHIVEAGIPVLIAVTVIVGLAFIKYLFDLAIRSRLKNYYNI